MSDYALFEGDSAAVLAVHMPAGSVDLTVTSPPYDDLRTYANGPAFDFAAIASELWRVTRPGGVVVWIVRDATVKGSETGSSFRQALAFMALGFRLHDTMIYECINPLPRPGPRYWPCWEYMFVFSRGAPAAVNLLEEPCLMAGENQTRTARDGGRDRLARSGNVTRATKPRRNLWRYSVGLGRSTADAFAFEHPAVMPERLAGDHILSWSNPGDLVLDPFMGSGTVGKMALLHDRRFVGVDIAPAYVALARQRLVATVPMRAVPSQERPAQGLLL